jgi:hypothetical protein
VVDTVLLVLVTDLVDLVDQVAVLEEAVDHLVVAVLHNNLAHLALLDLKDMVILVVLTLIRHLTLDLVAVVLDHLDQLAVTLVKHLVVVEEDSHHQLEVVMVDLVAVVTVDLHHKDLIMVQEKQELLVAALAVAVEQVILGHLVLVVMAAQELLLFATHNSKIFSKENIINIRIIQCSDCIFRSFHNTFTSKVEGCIEQNGNSCFFVETIN